MRNSWVLSACALMCVCVLFSGGCSSKETMPESMTAAPEPDMTPVQPAAEAPAAVEQTVNESVAAVVEQVPPAEPVQAVQERPERPAGPAGQRGRRGMYGDWKVKTSFNGREMESILSLSRNREGTMTGSWISTFGVNELKDVKIEDGTLSFVQERQGRDGQTMTSTFSGTINADGKLTGTLTGGRGEQTVEGERMPRMSRIAGSWEMAMNMGDRSFTGTLTLGQDDEGNLTGTWASERGESEISNIQLQRRQLSFKRTVAFQDNKMEMTFEGTVQGDTIEGVFTSEWGEVTTEGKRLGAEAIGTWNLELTGDRGSRKQRLVVYPDMSGLYGSMTIDKVELDGSKMSFDASMKFGDRAFEISFEGQIADNTLTGEMTMFQGSQQVTGEKVVRMGRRG